MGIVRRRPLLPGLPLLPRRLLLLLLLPSLVYGQDIVFPSGQPGRDACHDRLGRAARCVGVQRCPAVLHNLGQQRPVMCGFSGGVPKVCCPEEPAESSTEKGSPPPDAAQPYITAPAGYDNLGCGRAGSRQVPGTTRTKRAINDRRNVWPWMALLGERRGANVNWLCGGALLNQRWVLSAAHCFLFREINVVRLGEDDYEDDEDSAVVRDVEVQQVVLHPDYLYPRGYHDLALVELSADVIAFRDLVWPVCLAWGEENRRQVTGHSVTLTGWGDTQYGGFPSSRLQEVLLTVFPTTRCDEQHRQLSSFATTFPGGLGNDSLCAGYPDGGRDACQGDSGGPIVALNGTGPWGRYVVAGIVSRGYGCGKQDFFGLYANLRHPPYLAWIKQVAFKDPITVAAPPPPPLLPHIPPETVAGPANASRGIPGMISAPVNYEKLECGVIKGRSLLGGAGQQEPVRARRAVNTVKDVWPWMVALAVKPAEKQTAEFLCGGVLLNTQWVLTTAHCASFGKLVVRLGDDYLHSTSDGLEHYDRDVESVHIYPEYQASVGYHDLGLLKLQAPVVLQGFVGPVCLAWGRESKRNLHGHMVTLTGWGATSFGGEPSNTGLQDVRVTVFPSSVCDRQYDNLPTKKWEFPQGIGEEMVCAGYVDGGRDACQGDSGSPIVSRNSTGADGRYVLAGIVVGGHGCGLKDYFGYYANLRHPPYLAWIKQVAFADY